MDAFDGGAILGGRPRYPIVRSYEVDCARLAVFDDTRTTYVEYVKVSAYLRNRLRVPYVFTVFYCFLLHTLTQNTLKCVRRCI